MEQPALITDTAGRAFKTLRVSLTDGCNLACTYCTTGKKIPSARNREDPDRLTEVILRLHARLGFHAIRFTGGEPLLYPDIIRVIANTREAAPEVRMKMTTNGYLLGKTAGALAEAGLREVNVSLDALDKNIFHQITRGGGPDKVLQGIAAARDSGMEVKINSVILKGVNEEQIIPLLVYGYRMRIPVRFLEVMKMGHLLGSHRQRFVGMRDILTLIRTAGIGFTALGRAPHGTACYWQTPDGYRFGIIANDTAPFCHDCDRLRLGSRGNLYGCLSSNRPLPVTAALHDEGKLTALLSRALSEKKSVFTGSSLPMIAIGG